MITLVCAGWVLWMIGGPASDFPVTEYATLADCHRGIVREAKIVKPSKMTCMPQGQKP